MPIKSQPETLHDFATWLREAIAELEVIRVAPERDQSQYDYAETMVRTAERHARHIGAQAVCERCRCGSQVTSPEQGLSVLGECLAWCIEHMPATPENLTVQKAAEKLGVSPRTIYDLCGSGRLKCQRIGGGRGTIRIRPADLDSYANNSSSGGDGARRLIRR